jgi:hypothetical protein
MKLARRQNAPSLKSGVVSTKTLNTIDVFIADLRRTSYKDAPTVLAEGLLHLLDASSVWIGFPINHQTGSVPIKAVAMADGVVADIVEGAEHALDSVVRDIYRIPQPKLVVFQYGDSGMSSATLAAMYMKFPTVIGEWLICVRECVNARHWTAREQEILEKTALAAADTLNNVIFKTIEDDDRDTGVSTEQVMMAALSRNF